MKKRLISLALAFALCIGPTVPALAEGAPGDTAVTDAKGNTYTLSRGILYTVSPSDLDTVKLPGLNPGAEEWFGRVKNETSIIYAVPCDTLISAPAGIRFDCMLGAFIEEENGVFYCSDFDIGPGPGQTAFQLTKGWEGALFMFPCYTTNGADPDVSVDFVDNIAFFVPLDETAGNPFIAGRPEFTDVAGNAYYAEPVAWAVEKGIAAGTGDAAFSPDAVCTTAQILTFLWRSQGRPEPETGNPFSDVTESDYFYKAALWAGGKGLVSGSEFGGDTPCTRANTVTYLWKLAGSPSAPAAAFTDVPADADYAPAVAWAVSENITAGTGEATFSPEDACTRGQIVTFLYRAFSTR